MNLNPNQLDDLILEVALEEYWNTDDKILQEGWLDAIKGTLNIAQKFGLDDKIAEMALQKIVGVGKGDSIESVASLMSMIPDGGEEAGETGASIAGLMGDIMPAFRDLTSGNKKMKSISFYDQEAINKFSKEDIKICGIMGL